ncbi:MAG: hypothetical protein K0S80_5233 [Neobacillus sp.]|nr:hypothetical protein [Neobacillus sp.]
MMTIPKKCRVCGTVHSVEVKQRDFMRFQAGIHVQHAFPYLTADKRELLVSGVCGKCFDEIFAEEDAE